MMILVFVRQTPDILASTNTSVSFCSYLSVQMIISTLLSRNPTNMLNEKNNIVYSSIF